MEDLVGPLTNIRFASQALEQGEDVATTEEGDTYSLRAMAHALVALAQMCAEARDA
jgi:lysophospholipid acyltransferase (LPLAT)-like uncharacterized protein